MARDDYQETRELIQRRIEELEALAKSVDTFERMGISPVSIMEALTASTATAKTAPKVASLSASLSRKPNEPVNEDGLTWPEAVDLVLDEAPKALTVSQIVDELTARGRRFGERSRPDTVVRSTLKRCKDRYGWKGQGQPRKWLKTKEFLGAEASA